MAANSNINIVDLDFDTIKNNLKTFLNGQSTFNSYNFEGSALSVLLNVLAYNTHYNGYYLNMVANEMFLDSATKRSSVISHAKVLGYNPRSVSSPTATVKLTFNNVLSSSLTVPKFTRFLSESIDGVNYTFVTIDEHIGNKGSSNNVVFDSVTLKQGEPITYQFVYSSQTNTNKIFKIPDPNIDLTTLQVFVQDSSTNNYIDIYTTPDDNLQLDGTSKVYFIQESLDGYYEIYFGDGILGRSLVDGNIVILSYLSSLGSNGNSANSFNLVETIIGDYSSLVITPLTPATNGQEKESLNSIKYTAPKSYSAQGRAVSVNDYITLIQKNSGNFPIDSVNVWGGEENNPPVYGKVYIAIKPKGGYVITPNQKNKIEQELIKNISVRTVNPVIVDVDYTYLIINNTTLYDPRKTTLTSEQLKSTITSAIVSFANTTLNTFNSTFVLSDLITSVQDSNQSIITNENIIYLQKKITPILKASESYEVDFATKIKRDIFGKSVHVTPSFQYIDASSNDIIRENVYIEEVPASTTSLASIEIINPGYGYTSIPTITIVGDGTGATAEANIVNGKIQSITITNSGSGYTQAIVQITGGGGLLGSARAILQGQYGSLRSYYYLNGVKYILNTNVGTVDYLNGKITLHNFNPYNINNDLGILNINVLPESNIIYSNKDKLITLDINDSNAIIVNPIVKE